MHRCILPVSIILYSICRVYMYISYFMNIFPIAYFPEGTDERKICRFYGRLGSAGCWRGEACPWEHLEPHQLKKCEF